MSESVSLGLILPNVVNNASVPILSSAEVTETNRVTTLTASAELTSTDSNYNNPPLEPLPPISNTGSTDPSNPNFNPFSLPRLHTQEIPNHSLKFSEVKLGIKMTGTNSEYVDYGSFLANFNLLYPKHGMTVGSMTLVTNHTDPTKSSTLNPRSPDFPFLPFSEVKLELKYWVNPFNPTGYILLFKGYITSQPTFTHLGNNKGQLEVQIGDFMSYLSNLSNWDVGVNCNYSPNSLNTRKELGEVYLDGLGIEATLPSGTYFLTSGDIVEGNPKPSYDETPFDFLSYLYRPVGYNVRTSTEGYLLVVPDLSFSNDSAIEIDSSTGLEQGGSSTGSDPFRSITITNTFNQVTQPVQSIDTEIEYTSRDKIEFDDNGDAVILDRRPWYKSGITRRVSSLTYRGETLVRRETVVYGYAPKSILVNTGLTYITYLEGLDDPCIFDSNYGVNAPEGTPYDQITTLEGTEWGVVSNELYFLEWDTLTDGSRLIKKQVDRIVGLKSFQEKVTISGEVRTRYIVARGKVKTDITEWVNVPEINSKVCTFEYNYLSTSRSQEIREMVISGDNGAYTFSFVRTFWKNETWSGGSLDVYLSNSVVSATEWSKKLEQYTYDNQGILLGTTVSTTTENPQSAQIIPWNSTEINLNQDVSLTSTQSGLTRKSKPLNVSFCFDLSQAELSGKQWLRECVGESQSISLLLPPLFPITLGGSVVYTDSSGFTINCTVQAIEFSIDQGNLYKVALLYPWFD